MAKEPRSLRFKFYFILGLLLAGSMVAGNVANKGKVTGASTPPPVAASETLEQRIEAIPQVASSLKAQLSNLKSLDDFKAYTLTIYGLAGTFNDIKVEAAGRPELKHKVGVAYDSVSRLQVAALPRLRKAYADALASAMWENDIYVANAGGALQVTNVAFASNGNVKKVEEGLGEMIPLLRYKQTQYYWHKGSSYVSFDHKLLPDSTVAIVQDSKLVGIGN